jgi:hypothetical protein
VATSKPEIDPPKDCVTLGGPAPYIRGPPTLDANKKYITAIFCCKNKTKKWICTMYSGANGTGETRDLELIGSAVFSIDGFFIKSVKCVPK